MASKTRIKRFNGIDRLFHLFLMLTFIIQAATGFGRLYFVTAWGKKLNALFGGYETAFLIHKQIGILMLIGFCVHTVYLVTRIRWKEPGRGVFGPDSLVPNFQDIKALGQRILWFFGSGAPPRVDRWGYWEKFDYWAVYWGMPLLAITGLMTAYPMETSRMLPGWSLNIALFLHRAEAILAVAYIFIVHFFIGHLRPSSFPMNEGMFSGTIPLEEALEEKPAWVERLKKEGKLELAMAASPPTWYRIVYFVFGYAVLLFGVYLLINGIIYSRYISLH